MSLSILTDDSRVSEVNCHHRKRRFRGRPGLPIGRESRIFESGLRRSRGRADIVAVTLHDASPSRPPWPSESPRCGPRRRARLPRNRPAGRVVDSLTLHLELAGHADRQSPGSARGRPRTFCPAPIDPSPRPLPTRASRPFIPSSETGKVSSSSPTRFPSRGARRSVPLIVDGVGPRSCRIPRGSTTRRPGSRSR